MTISGSYSEEASPTSLLDFAKSQRRSSAITSTASCVSPKVFEESFSATEFDSERLRDLHASVKKFLDHALQLGDLQVLIQDLIQGVVLVQHY